MDNTSNSKIKVKTEKKLQKIFDNMACENPKHAIHGTAAAAAGIVALLPIGIDAWALRLCEIFMLISIYSHYGIKISKSVAESLMSAAFMQAVGELAAYAALEAADTATIATAGLGAPAAFGIKFGVASTLIEAVGWATVKYLEGNKLAEIAIHAADGIGVAADIGRVTSTLSSIGSEELSTTPSVPGHSTQISFCGDILKDIHELEIKIKNQESEIKMIKDWLDSDLRFNRDPTLNKNRLKTAIERLAKLQRELERLKA